MLLEIDPIGLVRNRRGPSGEGYALEQSVNDRPYAASSFLSVAIARTFGTAITGKSKERQELADTPLAFEAQITVLPCRGGENLLRRLFEPLGYEVAAARHPLDEKFPEWGESPYYAVGLKGTLRLSDLLAHLYVLIPVLDDVSLNVGSYVHFSDRLGSLPLDFYVLPEDNWQTIHATTEWQTMKTSLKKDEFAVDTDHFYIDVESTREVS